MFPEKQPFRSSITDRRPFSQSDRADLMEALAESLRATERGLISLKIPRLEGRMLKVPAMHYHFKPEVFVQLQGETRFECPRETLLLLPGEVGIMPAGVPHHETVSSGAKPFRNLVIGFYSNALSVHFAYEIEKGRPEIEVIEFYDAPNLDVFLLVTNNLVESFHQNAPGSKKLVKGLLITLLALATNLVSTGGDRLNQDIGKVFQAKWLVREQISNPKLSVQVLARKIRCSPDYLSHLFHEKTGEKLVRYIQRVRMEAAMLALASSPMYVSEIAWASGFADPAYFARVFKSFTGQTPQQYRMVQDKKHREAESAPKTIYFDRDDYSPGEPA